MSPLDRSKVQALADRAKHLTAISESPSYPILKSIIDAKVQRETRKFIATPTASQQELDYARGMLFGMQSILTIIEKGEEEFKKAMRMARVLDEAEGE